MPNIFSSYRQKTAFLLAVLVAAVMLLAACSGVEFGSLDQEQKGAEHFTGEESAAIAGEYVEGELIISLAANTRIDTLSRAQSREVMSASLQEQAEVLADTEFNLRSLFTDASQAPRTAGAGTVDFTISTALMQDIVAEMGYLQVASFPVDEYDDLAAAAAELEELFHEAGIEINYIEPNYKVRTASSQDMHPEQAWHYEMIKAPQAWERETGSEDIRIAVLDTGIDYDHGDLASLVRQDLGRNFTGPERDDVKDRHGHGTHVAGTIASYGAVSGVMQEASLIPVKVLDDVGGGNLTGIIEGLAHARDKESTIINMSFGMDGYSQSLADKVNKVRGDGIFLVAAAGNAGAAGVMYPARFDAVIAVGAVDGRGNRAEFSNYGSALDVMVPGVSIFSTLSADYQNGDLEAVEIDGENYAYMSGTSMSAPHVAGMAGLIKSFQPNISAADLEELIRDSAHNLGSSYHYGEGLIDAYRGVGGRITEPYF